MTHTRNMEQIQSGIWQDIKNICRDCKEAGSFTYKGTEWTRKNKEETEIRKRIISTNKVYYTHRKITPSK